MLKSGWFPVLAVVAVSTVTIGIAGCSRGATADAQAEDNPVGAAPQKSGDERASAPTVRPEAGSRELVLAGGCFWCIEAGFEQLRGVTDVVSGYAGGSAQNASYRMVAAGLTSHA